MIFFLKFLQFCFRIIFYAPAGIALSCMYAAAWLTQAIAKKTRLRETIIDNVKMVLPESNTERIANRLIENLSYSIFELLCLPFFKKEHFLRIFKFEGLEYLEQALKEEKGAILLTMHAGNYEVIPAALANLGYKVNSVLRATQEPIFEFLNYCRSHGGVKIVNVAEQDMYRETLNILSKNEIVGTLADTGALESRHVFYKFLGRDVPVATGWLTLAQRSAASVVPILTRKEGKINFIILYKPFKIIKETREAGMHKAAKVFEDFIQQNPEQWGIFLNSHETHRMVEGK